MTKIHYTLFAIQIVSVFAVVALSCYALGWYDSQYATLGSNEQLVLQLEVVDLPGWVLTATKGAASALILSVVADVLILVRFGGWQIRPVNG